MSQRHRVSTADTWTLPGTAWEQTCTAQCRAPEASPGKLLSQHGSTWRSQASPGKQGSCTAPARCAAQGFELACLTPAGQSLHGAGCHGQGTGSWAYLIAAHQENEMGGMLLDPDDQPAIKEEAVT